MNVSDIFRANAAPRPDAVAWIDERRSGVTNAALDAIVDAVARRRAPRWRPFPESRERPGSANGP